MTRRHQWIAAALIILLIGSAAFAQYRGNRRPREASNRAGVPDWNNETGFEKDVYSFTRIRYSSTGGRGGGRGWGWGGGNRWYIDAPDADLNLAYRLQQMTSLKVNPNETDIELTAPELTDYPFIYIVEPGWLEFSDEEVAALRKYLLNGGFLMVDDFWGDSQWQNFYEQMKRVFPDREPEDLEMTHQIFHQVFDLQFTRNQMQIPAVNVGSIAGQTGITWENHDGDCRNVHFRAFYDDKHRMVTFICHNTDNGDGWEREGENEYYFREFSEKKAYPLMINVIFYAMSH